MLGKSHSQAAQSSLAAIHEESVHAADTAGSFRDLCVNQQPTQE